MQNSARCQGQFPLGWWIGLDLTDIFNLLSSLGYNKLMSEGEQNKVTRSGKNFFSQQVSSTVDLCIVNFLRIPYGMHTFLAWRREKEEWRDRGEVWIMVGKE